MIDTCDGSLWKWFEFGIGITLYQIERSALLSIRNVCSLLFLKHWWHSFVLHGMILLHASKTWNENFAQATVLGLLVEVNCCKRPWCLKKLRTALRIPNIPSSLPVHTCICVSRMHTPFTSTNCYLPLKNCRHLSKHQGTITTPCRHHLKWPTRDNPQDFWCDWTD